MDFGVQIHNNKIINNV